MSILKRDLVKYIRDKAKSAYNKGTECYICGTMENLDFHHYHGLTELLEKWLKKTKLKIKTAEDIIAIREEFIALHLVELYEEAITICHTHHMKLHSIYGKKPVLSSAPKQKRWVEKQKDKNRSVINGLVE